MNLILKIKPSRHKVTLLSPPDTARIPPVNDHDTRHTTSGNYCWEEPNDEKKLKI